MLIPHLQRWLTTPNTKPASAQIIFWFSLSLTFGAVYSIVALQPGWGSEYVVQDDARQHLFWMQRFLDPELFPQNLVADYFQSLAPWGYNALYYLVAKLGIDPFFFSKLLPIGLGIMTTAYGFGLCLEILPIPAAGFLASLLLNQSLWISDDLASGTSRSFLYPLFLAFLYYLLKRSLLPCAVAIALQGLFYPPVLLISGGILVLRLWGTTRLREKAPQPDRLRHPYWFYGICLGVTCLVLLPEAIADSGFGPVMTKAVARDLLTFAPGGRTEFFSNDFWHFWLAGSRSGIRLSLNPPIVGAGFLLPILLYFPSRFPLTKQVNRNVLIFIELLLVSFGLFFAAHALLFKLYLPSRYTLHSLRITMALTAGIALILLLDAVLGWVQNQKTKNNSSLASTLSITMRQFLALGLTATLGVAIVFYPNLFWQDYFPRAGYVKGSVPELYEFFLKQPKNTLIASLAEEVNNLPSFSKRSILVGREYSIPYHQGYYNQFRQQASDLINAQYSPNATVLQDFIHKYEIDFLLLDRGALTPDYVANNSWLQEFQPIATETVVKLQQGVTPALAKLEQRCSVFETEGLVVLETNCILEAP